jgi:hypothetical protein
MGEAERRLKHEHRFIVQAGALWRGTQERELEPTATHRIELDRGLVEKYQESH